MCDFASFLITNTGEIKVYDMLSHSETAKFFNLKPETYREVEWTFNNPDSLEVRTMDTDSIIFKKARESILNLYPTRQDFLDKYMTEKVQLRMVKEDGLLIRYIKNPSENIKLKAIKQDYRSIQYIENPSEAIKLEAAKQNGYVIEYIKNPSEALQLAAVKRHGSAINYIKNPSEKVQLEAVKNNSFAYQFIKKPTRKVTEFFYANR